MKNDFFKCGVTGWCLEVLWTSMIGIKNRDKKMMGNTSLWMFPIYGLASVVAPLSRRMQKVNIIARGGLYTVLIFLTEFVTGSLLKKKNCCPWDYSESKYNVKGVIRLDYAPVWFGVGLFYEYILKVRTKNVK